MKILICVQIPQNTDAATPAGYPNLWRNYLREVESSTTLPKNATKLVEGTWLIDADGGLPYLLEVSRLAQIAEFPYKVLLIDEYTELTSKTSKGMHISEEAMQEMANSKRTR